MEYRKNIWEKIAENLNFMKGINLQIQEAQGTQNIWGKKLTEKLGQDCWKLKTKC